MPIQAKEIARPVLEHQADCKKITLANSIAYSEEIIPERDPIVLTVTPLLNVRSFRLYLKARRVLLNAGVLVP